MIAIKSKKIWFYIFISLIYLISFFNEIIVNEKLFEYQWNDYCAGILTITVLVYITHKYQTSEQFKNYLENQKLTILKVYFILLILVPLTSKLLTDKSSMIILHHFTKKQVIKIMYVDKVIHEKKCRQGIKIIGYKGNLCGFSKNAVDVLYHNQKIILQGEESIFGFTRKNFKEEKE